ncbi:MAG: bifunctional folylpolyglutamate synthase/dihydrofolate synthase [Winogradskyella sp.]|nr:bifunctional folylpolyglutamate synthase/dihydrofolate synthase [Winogradskyella sp.]
MNYSETLSWMFKQLPMYQRQGSTAFRKDLTNTIAFANHLGNPEKEFKTIHVGGTNGKGSTSHMLSSILQSSGYKVGLYTSPHLKDFRERIRINGKKVPKAYVIQFIESYKSFISQQSLSFFEMTVGMAFRFFADQKVDVAIIEVGMGGRLDSTNIITPILSVITNIGYDHTQFLGNTMPLIAQEKAGIIKPNIPVVIGEMHEETELIFLDKALKCQSPIYFADQLVKAKYDSDLKGNYQQLNIKTVIQTTVVLKSLGFRISNDQIKNGLENVMHNTKLKGRWQILQYNPKVICDTAHNAEGLKFVMQQLKEESYKVLHIVFGVVNDKNIDTIIPLLPKHATYYFCKPDVPRGLEANLLKDFFKKNGINGTVHKSVKQALSRAKKNATKEDVIYVGGSTFVVAEII